MSLRACALSFVALTALLIAGCGSPSGSGGSTSKQPVFKTTSCEKMWSGIANPTNVRCGYLVVPESRNVDNGRTVKLAVVIFKAPGPNPAPDPLVYLMGGPGYGAVVSYGSSIAGTGIPGFVGHRDLILVDQRGTGLSQPSLACPELNKPGWSSRALYDKALRACRARLAKPGVDLAAYNTVENAADIADLRTALGYKEVNLYGGSYGSSLALQVMRDHPQGIRSVVMDAITGPTFNEYNDFIPDTWHALQQVFRDCAASSYCSRQYPHLQQTFTRLVTRLQAHPAVLSSAQTAGAGSRARTMSGVELWIGLREALASGLNVPLVPRAIAAMAKGDYSIALAFAESQSSGASSTNDWGMYLSMECSNDQSGSSRATVAASARMIPAAIRSGVIAERTGRLSECAIWHVPSTAAVNRTYFRSAIPTLLLPGRYEPKTSLSQAQTLARKLSHAYLIPFPTMAHGVVGHGACSDGIVGAFLAHPDRRPGTDCIEQAVTWQ